ncbi:UNVERIFIED_CONTAM: Cytoplasmic phosphatidylinositol transfer protein 1 [Sesamum radiatum]|uniref:Cytoplasmic phosphatidylinositol transfer protein 1 n=1 Tax=Sesamum radiatum TaxID=300843 RepID=A0AAW2W9G0_SESRA
MPLSVEEFQIAQMYMIMKMQQQSTTGTEGVEIVENRPFEDDVYGKGQYTLKIYRLQSFSFSFSIITGLDSAPPQIVVKCPYFSRFILTIDTIHKDDNGQSENSQCDPVSTAYKLVTIDAPYWGFGSRLEQALLAGERALFLESHRNCFGWIDEWFGLSMDKMRELEKQSDSSLNQKLGRPCVIEDKEELDEIRTIPSC